MNENTSEIRKYLIRALNQLNGYYDRSDVLADARRSIENAVAELSDTDLKIAALTAELERVRGERAEQLEFSRLVCTERDQLRAKLAAAETRFEGHGKPCYYCHELTSDLSANPGKWSLGLCHADEPGVLKWHHEECVNARLRERDALREQLSHSEARERALRQEVLSLQGCYNRAVELGLAPPGFEPWKALREQVARLVRFITLHPHPQYEKILALFAETQKEPSPK